MSVMNELNSIEILQNGIDGDGQKFLIFSLGKKEYGIDILSVQEIRTMEAVTRIAHAPEFIKGVINLRGIIVPIVDLRIKFQLDDIQQNPVMIILNIAQRVVGILVDGVSDVLTRTAEQIMPAPEFGAKLANAYLTGLTTVDDRMVILVNIDKLMSSADMALIEECKV